MCLENVLIQVVSKRIRMIGVYVGERVITDLTPYAGWRVTWYLPVLKSHLAPLSLLSHF